MKATLQYLATILAFFIGYELLLPTSVTMFNGNSYEVPFLFTRIEIFKGFFLKDLLSFIFIFLSLLNVKTFKFNSLLKSLIFIYLSLFFYGIFIAWFNDQLYDIFENLRLLTIILVLICFFQSNKNKSLNSFALGVLVSGIINLFESYNANLYDVQPFFFLVNQNGPGPFAAILLLLFSDYRANSFFYNLFKIILFFIVIFSLSKIAYFMLILYFLKIIFSFKKKLSLTQFLFLLTIFSFLYFSFFTIYNQKFSSGVSIVDTEGGDQIRLAYYKSQINIFIENPIGISYSGYYDEISKQGFFKSGLIIEDSDERANAHSTILYYISSHGIFGVFILINLFWLIFYKPYPSKNIFTNLALMIYFLTVPFFFVTYFYVLPLVLLNKK